MTMDKNELDSFTRAYIECALWASNDDADIPLDRNYSESDLAKLAKSKMAADCESFQNANSEHITEDNLNRQSQCSASELAGHDFWLTRNGHGSGFWDGDWKEPAASILTTSAKAMGECNLYVGDDGELYCQ